MPSHLTVFHAAPAVRRTLLTGVALAVSYGCAPQAGAPGAAPPSAEPAPGDTRPQGEAHPSVTLPPDLARVLRDYETAWAAGDAAGLARLFTPDGFITGSRGWVRGRGDIQARYVDAGGSLRLRAVAYAHEGSLGYIVGAYGYGPAGEPTRDVGLFVLTLQRGAGGAWLIVSDMDRGLDGGP